MFLAVHFIAALPILALAGFSWYSWNLFRRSGLPFQFRIPDYWAVVVGISPGIHFLIKLLHNNHYGYEVSLLKIALPCQIMGVAAGKLRHLHSHLQTTYPGFLYILIGAFCGLTVARISSLLIEIDAGFLVHDDWVFVGSCAGPAFGTLQLLIRIRNWRFMPERPEWFFSANDFWVCFLAMAPALTVLHFSLFNSNFFQEKAHDADFIRVVLASILISQPIALLAAKFDAMASSRSTAQNWKHILLCFALSIILSVIGVYAGIILSVIFWRH